MTVSDIYGVAFMTEQRRYAEEYKNLADAIADEFGERKVFVDVGCGAGLLAEQLRARGWWGRGVDGSRFSPGVHVDLRAWLPTRESNGVVICTEVAEHLEREYAGLLCAQLVHLCAQHDGRIVFTAAPPGQGGTDHVNLQPKSYWLDLFAVLGAKLDVERTSSLVRRVEELNLEQWWYAKNLMVIRL